MCFSVRPSSAAHQVERVEQCCLVHPETSDDVLAEMLLTMQDFYRSLEYVRKDVCSVLCVVCCVLCVVCCVLCVVCCVLCVVYCVLCVLWCACVRACVCVRARGCVCVRAVACVCVSLRALCERARGP